MDTVLLSARTQLLNAFMSLPLILICIVGFLAAGLGNMGLFILFIGQTVILPLAVFVIQGITSTIKTDAFTVPTSRIGQLIPGAAATGIKQNVAPTYWMSHFLFFMGYLLANAVSIYTYKTNDKNLDPKLLSNRKSKAMMLIILTVSISLFITLLRYNTGTEKPAGIAIAYVVGGLLGYGWYQYAAFCGIRAADVFGITQQIIPSSAKENTPMTCVYAPRP